MTDLENLLAGLRDGSPTELVDRAAEALAESSEAVSALADRDDYDTATLWWAAGTLGEAYAAILPHTGDGLPDPPDGPRALANDTDRLTDVLDASAAALTRASRAVTEPDRIYALAHAAILTEQARIAFVNARVRV